MYDEEFDEQALARLVAEALADAQAPTGRNAVAYGDTQILEALAGILPEYIDKADVAAIFDRVRTALYEGLQFGDLRSLHTTIKHCRVCPNVKPDPQLPVWNKVDPDVVFVADTPWSGSPADTLLAEALKQVGFSSRRICYTSTVRCFPTQRRQPSPAEGATCASRYLYSELQQMAPKLIVTLGAIPTAALLGQEISVTEVRGTTYWLGLWPVLVTVSPGYAGRAPRGTEQLITDLTAAYTFAYGVRP